MEKELNDNIADMVTTALLMSVKSHLWHFTTRSYSKHKAYEELYELCQDKADDIAEAAMGIGVTIEGETDRSMNVAIEPENDSIGEIKAFFDYLMEIREDLEEEGVFPLVTLVDDFMASVSKVIYKLERLS